MADKGTVVHAFFSVAEYAATKVAADSVTHLADQWSMPPNEFPAEPIQVCLSAIKGQIPGLSPHFAVGQHTELETHLETALADPKKVNWGGLLKLVGPILQQLLPILLSGGFGGV